MRSCFFGSATYCFFRLCRCYLKSPAGNGDSIYNSLKVASSRTVCFFVNLYPIPQKMLKNKDKIIQGRPLETALGKFFGEK